MPRSRLKPLRRRTGASTTAAAVLALVAATTAYAEPQPSVAMMAPVQRLVAFMSSLPAGEHADVFIRRGLCIVENFAPFVFCGTHAAARWEAGFRAHVADLTELTAVFAEAHDFTESGSRAYFSLPTTWQGRTNGKHFEEHGAWAFVLEHSGHTKQGAEWRIAGYGWGVTAYMENP